MSIHLMRCGFNTSPFAQSLRQAQILILEILQYIHPKGTYFVAPVVNPALGGTRSEGVGLSTRQGVKSNILFLDGHLLLVKSYVFRGIIGVAEPLQSRLGRKAPWASYGETAWDFK